MLNRNVLTHQHSHSRNIVTTTKRGTLVQSQQQVFSTSLRTAASMFLWIFSFLWTKLLYLLGFKDAPGIEVGPDTQTESDGGKKSSPARAGAEKESRGTEPPEPREGLRHRSRDRPDRTGEIQDFGDSLEELDNERQGEGSHKPQPYDGDNDDSGDDDVTTGRPMYPEQFFSHFPYGFARQEKIVYAFPDAEVDVNSLGTVDAYTLITTVYPKDYSNYPTAPRVPKTGEFTAKNQDRSPPGLVVSTVEDTTPRDKDGRYITPPYPVEYTCGWCGSSSYNMLVCRGCKKTRYCNDQCQEEHWVWHRHKCMNDPDNAVDFHEGATLEIEMFMDSEDELRYEPEERKAELREERRKEKERRGF
ncbi:unnamed protein product [Lymnaea stagnalis]|uniref:MYND-type domain-containing protein n=1 Tax=Lymnaea stagnalis TaxID=6523 RepID=A0AAV2HRU1_LYMST